MGNHVSLTDRTQALRLLGMQLVVGLLLGLALLPLGWVHSISALLGGAIAFLGSLYFAGRVFVRYRAEQPERLLGRLYRAEIGKVLIVSVLFAVVVILVRPLSIVALLAGYLCAQSIAPLLSCRRGP